MTIQARFSNAGKFGKDDRAASVRGCLLKLNFGNENMDLLFNTGSTSVFENYLTFAMNAMANQSLESNPPNLEGFNRWLYARPANYYNLIDMLVKGPSSYTKLRYYTKFPVLLTDSNGKEHYCKFRLVPYDKNSPIEGLLTEDEQREVWKRAADQDDVRSKDYLRTELHHRITSEPEVLLRLEIMSKVKTGLERQSFFHPSADWRSPWQDLAVVKLSGVLTTDEMRNLWGAPGNLPSGLSLIKPINSCDPNWTSYARHEIYTRNAHIREVRESFGGNPIERYSNHLEANMTFEVEVHTGDMKYAGTDCDVFITIVGNRASTQKHYMDQWYKNDFEQGSKDTYKFNDRNIGTIEYIIVGIDPECHMLGDSSWFLEKIIVTANGVQTTFPHHQWVTDGTTHRNENPLIITTNRSLLPGEETTLRQTARMMQAMQHQEIIKWSHDLPTGDTTTDVSDALPGFLKVPGLKYDDLDPRFAWYEEHYAEYRDLRASLLAMNVRVTIKNFFDPISYYEEYTEVADRLGCDSLEHKWLEDWDKDAEFGRQTLNGMNPIGIHRIRFIPEKFAVNEETVDGLLTRGLTLEEELASGHIYMVDFEILDGVSTGTYQGRQLEMAAAMALFYHEPENDDLLPIAIQLGQRPGPDCPIWTPKDTRDDWLQAKFWFRNADAQVGQLVTHLAQTHFFIEPFAVAMHRNFSSSHPVFKILKEHLKFIIAVDTRGREVLIAPGGAGDVSLTTGFGSNGIIELLTKAYKDMTFDDFHYPNHLKRRDMMDLPGYHHRDDAIALWDITFDYIKSFVDVFYDSDKEVKEDWEVQAWIKDVHDNGFGKIKNPKEPALGFPTKLDNKEELVMYLTKLIYTDTTRHSFANFYVFEYTRFAPNSPTVMRGKLPREEDRGKATMASVLESLPSRTQAAISCSTSKVLANYAVDEIYLTQTPSWLFEEGDKGRKAKEVFDVFTQNLTKAEAKMRARNEKLKVPYTVLYPSKIPAGISV